MVPDMRDSVPANVRPTNGTLFAIVPAALLGGGLGVGLGLLWGIVFPSADMLELLLSPTPLVIATVWALFVAAGFIANRRGFAPTEVHVEDGRLIVQTPEEWWLRVTDQFPLTVRTVERRGDALVVTGILDRWWDWGRYTVQSTGNETETLEAHLVELQQE